MQFFMRSNRKFFDDTIYYWRIRHERNNHTHLLLASTSQNSVRIPGFSGSDLHKEDSLLLSESNLNNNHLYFGCRDM